MAKKSLVVSFIAILALSVSVFAASEFESIDQITQYKNDNMMYFLNLSDPGNAAKFDDAKMTEEEFDKFIERLDISEAKQLKIKNIRKTSNASKKKYQSEIKAKYKALNKELVKKVYKKKHVKNIKKNIKTLNGKLSDVMVNERIQVRGVVSGAMYTKVYRERTIFDKLGDELMLSDEQQSKLEELFNINGKQLVSLRQQLSYKKKALEYELVSERNDREIIEGLTSDICDTSKSILQTIVNTRVYLKTILTTEQYDKFNNTTVFFNLREN